MPSIFFLIQLIVGNRKKPFSDIFLYTTFISFIHLFTIKDLKKNKKLLQFIYKTVADIFFDSFFDCLIFLNSPLSSFKRFHISPSLTLFSSDFSLGFLIFSSSAFSRLSANRFVARSFTSCSSLSLNSLKFLIGFCLC